MFLVPAFIPHNHHRCTARRKMKEESTNMVNIHAENGTLRQERDQAKGFIGME